MATNERLAILDYFTDLPDPRRETKNKRHLLIDILVIGLCATIAGCESAVEFEEYGESKENWLRRFLKLPNGIPSHDTFSRVLAAIDPQRFHACFVAWVNALHEVTAGEVVNIDGKTLRRSFDRGKGIPALHIVSAWANDNGLVLGQVAVDDKSNEITAIPKLLEILELRGALVTIDAMGCQKEIAAAIRDRGADYVLAVKENQPHLYEDLSAHFANVMEEVLKLPRRQRHHTKEKNRGRMEERYYYSTPVPENLRNKELWTDLNSIGCVVSVTKRGGQQTVELRHYISSLAADGKELARAVRGHWGIENRQHWVLDVVFNEDQSRARAGNEAENLGLMRRMALNMVKNEGTKRSSLKVKRKVAGWDDDLMSRILIAGTT
jgi:predicted transposase YbfD/YdcC